MRTGTASFRVSTKFSLLLAETHLAALNQSDPEPSGQLLPGHAERGVISAVN